MDIVFFGTGSFGIPAMNALLAAGHPIRRAISQPDRPAGRGRNLVPTPVRAAAERLGIPHFQAADVNALPVAEVVDGAALGVVIDFGQKIGPVILRELPRGCINLHGSLLPRYRGAAPYQWAILNGDATTGVTVFQLNEQWDAGAIWGRRETPIGDTETADELHDRLALLGADLVVECVERIARGELPMPQESAAATRAPKLKKADGDLDWARPAAELVRWINGLWSWPAATAEFVSRTGRRERVQLARARLGSNEPVDAPPGAIRPDLGVATGAGSLRVLEIKPAGKALMSFEAFANGRQVGPGDRFERPRD